jgi:hypothetical protein
MGLLCAVCCVDEAVHDPTAQVSLSDSLFAGFVKLIGFINSR